MKTSQKLIERRHAVVARGVGQFAGDTTVVSARGARLVDADGREWIDLAGGIGVMNVGHCDPAVVAAIREQAGRLLHGSIHVATYELYVALCEQLVELLPHGGSTKAVLVNSGAEAVENAVKIARQATGRPAILCYSEAFHGRTLLGMTLTSKTAYKLGCGPFAPEIYRLPYPDHFHLGDGLDEASFVRRELDRLEDAFGNRVPAQHVAAVIIEPVLGEGGFIPAPAAYLRGLRETCDRHGILLIADEVQTGFCRTGRWAAYEHAGVVPDLSTWAKSMGGGMPISAVLGKAEIMDAALPGTIGGTFGGNPVACAAALATIGVLRDHHLNERADAIGKTIRTRFERLKKQCDWVGDVRGLGAMIAMELCHGRDPARPAKEQLDRVLSACRERGVMALPASRSGNVLRILCPLVITEEDLEQALTIIEESVLSLTEKANA
jgi:4-aminobutyrate aminotransferase/(S)-3-amino-2-methylpropionate transaminase